MQERLEWFEYLPLIIFIGGAVLAAVFHPDSPELMKDAFNAVGDYISANLTPFIIFLTAIIIFATISIALLTYSICRIKKDLIRYPPGYEPHPISWVNMSGVIISSIVGMSDATVGFLFINSSIKNFNLKSALITFSIWVIVMISNQGLEFLVADYLHEIATVSAVLMFETVIEYGTALVLYENTFASTLKLALFCTGVGIQFGCVIAWLLIQGMIENRDRPNLAKEPLSCVKDESDNEVEEL